MKTLSLNQKVMWGLLGLSVVMLAAVGFGSAGLKNMINAQLDREEDLVIETIESKLSVTQTLMGQTVESALRILKMEASRFGAPHVDGRVQIGEHDVPNLYFGKTSLHGDHRIVDQVKALVGGTATLFVRSGDSFVRVSTNVTKSDGSRAIGTKLDPQGRAIKALQKGQAFYGIVDILGEPYITAYEPINADNGDVIGVWYTGYALETLKALAKSINDVTLLENGFVAVVDPLGKVRFKSKKTPERFFEQVEILGWIHSGVSETTIGNWQLRQKPLPSWNTTIVTVEDIGDIQAQVRMITAQVLGWMLALIFIGLGVFFVMSRKLSSQLTELASRLHEVASSYFAKIDSLRSTSDRLSSSATEQAASIEETVASLEMISNLVRENSKKALRASEVSESNANAAEESEKALKRLTVSIEEISRSSTQSMDIIAVIEDIAFQTNLLALNAAVEAARAGEQGRGFSVVAEAVRALAQKSSAAAQDISKLIRESANSTKTGVVSVSESARSIQNVVAGIREVAVLNKEVMLASRDQAQSVDDIKKAMTQIDIGVQATAQGSESLNNDVGGLLEESTRVTERVDELRLIVRGESGAGPQEAALHQIKNDERKARRSRGGHRAA